MRSDRAFVVCKAENNTWQSSRQWHAGMVWLVLPGILTCLTWVLWSLFLCCPVLCFMIYHFQSGDLLSGNVILSLSWVADPLFWDYGSNYYRCCLTYWIFPAFSVCEWTPPRGASLGKMGQMVPITVVTILCYHAFHVAIKGACIKHV